MRTRAKADGDDWVLNGSKCWITNGGKSSWYTVMAVTDPDAPRHERMSMFIIPAGTPGLEIVRDVGHVGKLHMGGVNRHHAVLAVHIHVHAVQAQQIGHHVDIADFRHILQDGLTGREQGGNHGLAYEILGSANLDRAMERLAALNMEHIVFLFDHVDLFRFPCPDTSVAPMGGRR